MKKGVIKTIKILLLTLFIFSLSGEKKSNAAIGYLDGRLLLKGNFETFWIVRTYIPGKEREWHNSNVGLLQNTARFETFYTMLQKEDFSINLQSIIRYYYEAITDLDREMHNALPAGNRRQFQTPCFRYDDPVNEFFLEIVKGPWNIRVGKQIVTWGETELKRTTDVVNPMDLRYAMPGIVPFEDIKIGLWMLRTFYQSNLPGSLLFETIFIPTDHQMTRLPPSGTNWGSGLLNKDAPSSVATWLFPMMQDQWKDDAPSRRSINNYQWGFKLRGLTKDVDWTIQYFDAVDSSPVGKPTAANQQVFAYFLHGPSPHIPKVADRVWEYKRTKYVGATLQWPENIYLKGVIRGELCYQIGKHYNTLNIKGKPVYVPAFTADGLTWAGDFATQTSLITGIVESDAFGYGLAIDRPVLWPWLMQYNDHRKLDITFQVFQDWILDHSRDLKVSNRGIGDRCSTAVSLSVSTMWFNQAVNTNWKSLYYDSGTGYNVFDVLYMPGDHWRFTVGAFFAYSFTSWTQEPASYDKDMFYFRIKYEW